MGKPEAFRVGEVGLRPFVGISFGVHIQNICYQTLWQLDLLLVWTQSATSLKKLHMEIFDRYSLLKRRRFFCSPFRCSVLRAPFCGGEGLLNTSSSIRSLRSGYVFRRSVKAPESPLTESAGKVRLYGTTWSQGTNARKPKPSHLAHRRGIDAEAELLRST